MPQFELFTKRLSRKATDPYVTIQKKGTMSMNRPSYELLAEPEAVELLFDAVAQIVGLRAVDPASSHAYPLRASGKGESSFLLSGVAFAKYYGIDTEVARRYPATLSEGVLQIDLTGESSEVISNRNRAARDAELSDALEAIEDSTDQLKR